MNSKPGETRRKRSKPRVFLLTVLGLVIALGLAELGLRLFYPFNYRLPPEPISAELQRTLIHQPSALPGVVHELAPGRSGSWRGARVEINSLGMRDAEPRSLADASVHRIAAIGDSFTFGWSVPIQFTYPDILERKLNVDAGDVSFEVLNFGVGGYTSRDEAVVLEHRAIQWDPELVVVGYYFNDPEIEPRDPLNSAFREVAWWQHSALLRLILRTKFRWEIKTHGGGDYFRYLHYPPGYKWQSVVTAFGEMHRVTAERGIPVLLVIFPLTKGLPWDEYEYGDLHEQITAAAEAAGFEVLDLRNVYSQHPCLDLMVSPHNNHPSKLGHRLAARAIHEWIRAREDELFGDDHE